CKGTFFRTAPDGWFFYDSQFTTPSTAGETVVLALSENDAASGSHNGTMAVNARLLVDPIPAVVDFQATDCQSVPIPVPDNPLPGSYRERTPITLDWRATAIQLPSGSEDVITGYRVYMLDADVYDPAISTIDDYIQNGDYRGSTVGQADINMFVDMAPDVPPAVKKHYTYAIQPILEGFGPLTFGGDETTPGTSNLSTDSATIEVEESGFVDFDFWNATLVEGGVEVTWGSRTEIDTLGFYVLRGTSPDETQLEPIHSIPITATGSGSTYSFMDEGADPRSGLYYQILELAGSGEPSKTPVFTVSGDTSRSVQRERTGRTR
ncbi:hypothetical protein ACFLU6_16380, partial [Acidobacteriota bacterium]